MKLTLQRTLFEIVNFLMALLFVIPLGVLVEQSCGFDLWRCCFIPCLSVLGFIMGRVSLTRSSAVSMLLCAAGFVSATALSILLSWGLGLAVIFLPLISAVFSLFYYFSARKAAYTIYAPMAIGGIGIHLFVLLCCAGFGWESRVTTFTSIVAICFFLLTLFAFSFKGLRRSMHRGSGAKQVTYPAGMQMGNFILVAIFIVVTAFISSIYPIFRVFSTGFAYILRWLMAAFSFVIDLFSRRSVSVNADEEIPEETIASDSILNAEPRGEAAWLTTAVAIFAFLCVVALVVYFLVWLIRKLSKTGGRFSRFMRNLRNRFAPVTDEDYVDETESLFDMKKMLSDTRENMRNALKKIRERPQRIDDFPDTRMKVRFAFQQLLKKVKSRNPKAANQTPNEIYEQEYNGEEDFREFIDYYNQAKYSDQDLPEDAERCAREILKQKL